MTTTHFAPVAGEYGELLHKHFSSEFCKSFLRYGDLGTVMTVHFKRIADDILNLEIRDDDTFICGFPKSGTNWAQEMIWCIANDLDFEGAKVPMAVRCPFLEWSGILDAEKAKDPKYEFPRELWDSVGFVKEMPSPRFIKTHLPFNMLPLQLQQGKTGAKIVHLRRDVKDVNLSYIHHYRLHLPCRADYNEFATLFINDAVMWAPYWENVLTYLRKKGDKNILHLRFEDMKKDLPSIIKKTAGFLGKPLSDQQVDVLLKHLSFENMKGNDAVNMENLKGHYEILTGNKVNDHIMRDGQAGGWREKLSPDWVRRFDEWTEKKLQGTGISLSDE
uniref:Sulfotransferase domain-containing protein n=1 Tax=Homalodisca liturata TaxID=320908 RepID=A0A1B6JC27_9HEMI